MPRLLLGGRRDRRLEEPLEEQGGGLRLRRALAPELLAAERRIDSACKTCFAARTSSLPPPLFPRETQILDRYWRGAQAPVSFAPLRRGRGRRVSQWSRSGPGASPVPHPVLGHARGCASATCAEHSPTPHSKTVSAAWERLPYNRTPSGKGQPKPLLQCGFGRPLPALAASQRNNAEERRYH